MATQKQMEQAKRRTHKHLVKWKPLVGLAPWTIHQRFYRREKDIPKKYARAAMWCAVDYEYLTATVHVALCRIAHETTETIEMMVRHELLHVTVNEMRQWRAGPVVHCMQHEERTVSTLTAAFDWTYNAGWNEGRAALRRKTAKKSKPKE